VYSVEQSPDLSKQAVISQSMGSELLKNVSTGIEMLSLWYGSAILSTGLSKTFSDFLQGSQSYSS